MWHCTTDNLVQYLVQDGSNSTKIYLLCENSRKVAFITVPDCPHLNLPSHFKLYNHKNTAD
jgi:hypothetical protein